MLVVAALIMVWAWSAPVASAAPPAAAGPVTQVFADEFNSSGLNTSVWNPGWLDGAQITGPMSNACVARSNVSQLGDGLLRLKMTLPDSTCQGTTATETGALVESSTGDGVSGHSGFDYNYGYVEWAAQMPAGTGGCGGPSTCIGATPGLWSMPDAHDFEIDTVEGYHGQGCWNTHGWDVDPGTTPFGAPPPGCVAGAPLTTSFHTYGALWSPSGVEFYYDGVKVGNGRAGVHSSANKHFLVMDMINMSGTTQGSAKELLVNYVRVWQPDGDGDGVPDSPARNSAGVSDDCPTQAGTAAGHGCPAPSADGAAASSVTLTGATLNGSVNAHGRPTTYRFEYGTTTNYGSFTAWASAGSSSSAVNVNAQLSGLKPGTTYHYRLVASSDAGTGTSGDRSLTTSSGWLGVGPQSDQTLAACISTSVGSGDCTTSLWPINAGTNPAAASIGDGNSVIAFSGSGGELGECSLNVFVGGGCWSSHAGITSGTSPAVAAFTAGPGLGTALAVFNSPTVHAPASCVLTASSTTTCTEHQWLMAADATPSATALGGSAAGVAMAFRHPTGSISTCIVIYGGGSSCNGTDPNLLVAAGTTPAITTLTSGTYAGTAEIAFATPSGTVKACHLTLTNAIENCVDGWAISPGASPAIAPLSDGSAAVVFAGGSSQFTKCRFTGSGGGSCGATTTSMTVGTTPAITQVTGGSAVATFRSYGGTVAACQVTDSATNCADTTWFAASGSRPTVTALRDGNAVVVFRAGAGTLANCRVTPQVGSNCGYAAAVPPTLAAGANPAATSIP